MDIANILGAIGSTAQGAVPVIQQQQAAAARQQAMSRLLAMSQQQGLQPGFSPYNSANIGTPAPNGMPPMPPVAGMPGGAPNPMGGAQPGQPPAILPVSPMIGGGASVNPMVTPYGGPSITPSGDPFSYANVANAFYGPDSGAASNPLAASTAYDATEKTLRPYGQMQTQLQKTGMQQAGQTGRTQMNIDSREGIEAAREQGRNSRFYAGLTQQMQKMGSIDLRSVLTTASQQIAAGTADEATLAKYAAASDVIQKKAAAAGYKSEFPPAPDNSGAASGQATVTVVSPDGQVGTVPAAQLQDAIKQGYKKQ